PGVSAVRRLTVSPLLPCRHMSCLSNLSTGLSPKIVAMLLRIAPKLSRVAILVNPTNLSHAPVAASLQAAAESVNLEIGAVEAATTQQVESAFAKMSRQNAGAVIVVADALFLQEGQQIAELARKHRMPSVFPFREQVDAARVQHLYRPPLYCRLGGPSWRRSQSRPDPPWLQRSGWWPSMV